MIICSVTLTLTVFMTSYYILSYKDVKFNFRIRKIDDKTKISVEKKNNLHMSAASSQNNVDRWHVFCDNLAVLTLNFKSLYFDIDNL